MRIDDDLLAVRCQLGERDAFDELIRRWHEPLWNYARRLTGDEDAAADTVQEAWLRVLRGIAGLRDPARLRAWLFGIARRVVMDRLRAKYGQPAMVAIDEADLAGADDARDLADDINTLHEEPNQLPLLEREVLVLVAGCVAVGSFPAAAFGSAMLAIAVAMLVHARRRFAPGSFS